MDWQTEFGGSLDLQFQTLHRAKGLEADYVFILGCNASTYGLPSSVEDDPLLSMVLSRSESFVHAEERRLFYVGLTRARHRCHVLTRRGQSSPFVRELVGLGEAVVYRVGYPRPIPVKAWPCPNCADGIVREVPHEEQIGPRCSNASTCPDTQTRGSVAISAARRVSNGRENARDNRRPAAPRWRP